MGVDGTCRKRCHPHAYPYRAERQAARKRTGFRRETVGAGARDLPGSSIQSCAHELGARPAADRSVGSDLVIVTGELRSMSSSDLVLSRKKIVAVPERQLVRTTQQERVRPQEPLPA